MFSLPQRQIYNVTSDSPLVLSPTSTTPSLTPRTTVVFRGLKGQGREYTLQGTSLTKVIIDGCENLQIRLHTPLLTGTLDVYNSSDVKIHLGASSSSQPVASTVIMDPPLPNVELIVPLAHPSPRFVASSVIPPSSTMTSEQAWEGTTLRAGDGEEAVALRVPVPPKGGPEQWTFKLQQEEGKWGWTVEGLQREDAGGEGAYPILK